MKRYNREAALENLLHDAQKTINRIESTATVLWNSRTAWREYAKVLEKAEVDKTSETCLQAKDHALAMDHAVRNVIGLQSEPPK